MFHFERIVPPLEWSLDYGATGDVYLQGYERNLFYEIAYWRYVRENKDPVNSKDQIDKIVITIDNLMSSMKKNSHYVPTLHAFVTPLDPVPEDPYEAYINLALGPYASIYTNIE
jgi:hypothetical protein